MSESTQDATQVALVTGSGRGIGLACAQALAAAGYDVCMNCSGESGFERTQKAADDIAAAQCCKTNCPILSGSRVSFAGKNGNFVEILAPGLRDPASHFKSRAGGSVHFVAVVHLKNFNINV